MVLSMWEKALAYKGTAGQSEVAPLMALMAASAKQERITATPLTAEVAPALLCLALMIMMLLTKPVLPCAELLL